ncbi:sulfatase-like hydrolase/transferase [Saccharomonospora azurea]|uniref:sulfatase-like hydrolase/transferase n=1 Tax=Saccharomonospora azurea TaxID=40988 RepID=UPI0038CD3087
MSAVTAPRRSGPPTSTAWPRKGSVSPPATRVPWCSSTQISLYTGRYPGRLPAGLEEPLVTRSEGPGIPADHPTLPSLLAGAGYRTAMFGK